jgi:hypothetical protein
MKYRSVRSHHALRYAPVALALACSFGGAWAASKVYTLDADFDLGILTNVNHSVVSNQLQLNVTGGGFPVLWIANAGEHSLSKFDTTQIGASPGREVARYYTWFSTQGPTNYAWSGPAPSRTAVDTDGNAYVLNRHFDGRSALLIKVLANSFVDRNGNGVVDSSSDTSNDGKIQAAEMKPLVDTNGNGIIEDSEIQDERIAWAIRVPDGVGAPLRAGSLGRSLCMGTDGNLWVGLYSDGTYYKVSSLDGHTIAGPIPVPNVNPYGCLIDKDGTLWSASLGSYLGKITNTQSNNPADYVKTSYYHGNYGSNYGIALGRDAVDQRTIVYLGGTGYSYLRFDSASNAFSVPASIYYSANGVNTDGNGNIVVSKSSGGVVKFTPAGATIFDKAAQGGASGDSRGVMPDASNDLWQVSLASNAIAKFKGSDGTALGVLPTGNSPYTYSDASGFAAANITVQTGTWGVIQNSGADNTPWGTVSWNASVPTGASVAVKVRAANTEAALQGQTFVDVANGSPFGLSGRYLEAQVRLSANNQKQSPVVQDVTIATKVASCDVDGDGDVDTADLALVRAGIGKPVTASDPRDANGDGVIDARDVRACTLKCTRTSCATN